LKHCGDEDIGTGDRGCYSFVILTNNCQELEIKEYENVGKYTTCMSYGTFVEYLFLENEEGRDYSADLCMDVKIF
jgi:hypothetical protein